MYIDHTDFTGSFYTWPPRSNFRALSRPADSNFCPGSARAHARAERETTTISFVRVAQATGPRVSPRVVTRPSRGTSRVRENFSPRSILFGRTFLLVGTRELCSSSYAIKTRFRFWLRSARMRHCYCCDFKEWNSCDFVSRYFIHILVFCRFRGTNV